MTDESESRRLVKRCPECGSTAWRPRSRKPMGGLSSDATRYRCTDAECGVEFDKLEESETDHGGERTHGLAKKLVDLAEEHDGDVPIRTEGSA